jgi:nucleoside-diphosphate-sugar epimerase
MFSGARAMALKVLFIGGSGEISLACVKEAVAAGHGVTVFNRSRSEVEALPKGVERLVGDAYDPASRSQLKGRRFDVVCQFMAFRPEHVEADLALFAGATGQYIFISSASAYQKPARHYVISEKTPLENPYWEYSRLKKACEEKLLSQSAVPFTIVRPSHTVRNRTPTQLGDKLGAMRRMLARKPVVLAGDGSTPWTLTRSEDFAKPFVRLWGQPKALGDYFHICNDKAFTWNQIHDAIAAHLGVEAKHAHVPTDTLVRYNPAWEGPLRGDKAWTAIFDNSKVKAVAGDYSCSQDLAEILAGPMAFAKRALAAEPAPPTSEEDALMDRIVADQARLGLA